MQYVYQTYGIHTEADLERLNNSLRMPFHTDSTFNADAVVMATTFRILANAGQPKSEVDKMQALEAATSNLVSVTRAIVTYKEAFPLVHDRSFANMVAHIRTHAPNITVGAAGYVASATTDIERRIQAGIEEGVRLALEKRKITFDNRNRNTAGRGGRHGRQGGRRLGYCFLHGYGHSGLKCYAMAADPGTYTIEMVNATAPVTINGLHGKN